MFLREWILMSSAVSLLLWFISFEITGFKSGPECLPSGSGADAAGHCTAACIFGIHGDAILLTLSQSVLNALFDLALVRLAGGDALHVHRATWHFLTAIFHVDLVAAAVVRQIGRLVFTVAEILHLYLARHLIRPLEQLKKSLIVKFIGRSIVDLDSRYIRLSGKKITYTITHIECVNTTDRLYSDFAKQKQDSDRYTAGTKIIWEICQDDRSIYFGDIGNSSYEFLYTKIGECTKVLCTVLKIFK